MSLSLERRRTRTGDDETPSLPLLLIQFCMLFSHSLSSLSFLHSFHHQQTHHYARQAAAAAARHHASSRRKSRRLKAENKEAVCTGQKDERQVETWKQSVVQKLLRLRITNSHLLIPFALAKYVLIELIHHYSYKSIDLRSFRAFDVVCNL